MERIAFSGIRGVGTKYTQIAASIFTMEDKSFQVNLYYNDEEDHSIQEINLTVDDEVTFTVLDPTDTKQTEDFSNILVKCTGRYGEFFLFSCRDDYYKGYLIYHDGSLEILDKDGNVVHTYVIRDTSTNYVDHDEVENYLEDSSGYGISDPETFEDFISKL